VAKSIFVLRERFGLKIESYEVFLKTPYKNMWAEKEPDSVVTNVRTLTGSAKFPGAVDFFKGIDMTPRDFWEYYIGAWGTASEKTPNIINVKYDSILKDFDGTMAHIGKMLHCDVDRFQNLDRKVGWWK